MEFDTLRRDSLDDLAFLDALFLFLALGSSFSVDSWLEVEFVSRRFKESERWLLLAIV